ncbi:dTDP-glucose 4,6-dehydratase [Asanoa ishikariensis]|uniref:dTDP-glucose 4,6-dehydratase n=1 Tax=Asanoa ishikariensis TaxID=137265 RepID=A0A1H3MJB2_9ACTN|nr:dTDP-glucose 4,6-dehydratase [Asanoa ishikariensis]GIF66165.1 dTDP-glucose 4,6-dehydratase [Asanoa ishikariensis]SDY76653.1 dTDP-glucose 4,6-dehydratase [Asanoa ishikariensis]
MQLLVTGAAGFIGSNFVRYLSRHHPGDRVVALDALTYAGNRASLPSEVEFVHADIADAAHALTGVDVVVNFAAESHNSRAVHDPQAFFTTNVLGTQRLLEASRRAGIARFHHVSTCEVYGDLALDDPGAFTEESPYRPRTPYNASKAGADHAVRAYHETYGLPVTITVCANNYGPRQFPEKVIPLFATRALRGQPLPVYRSSANRREWLHVDDHCAAIDRVLHDGRLGTTYHVGSGVEVSVADLAASILSRLGLPLSLIETVPDRPGHDRRYLLDSTLIRSELGWSPTIAFEQGLEQTITWYAENRAWWEPLLDRAAVDEAAWA